MSRHSADKAGRFVNKGKIRVLEDQLHDDSFVGLEDFGMHRAEGDAIAKKCLAGNKILKLRPIVSGILRCRQVFGQRIALYCIGQREPARR